MLKRLLWLALLTCALLLLMSALVVAEEDTCRMRPVTQTLLAPIALRPAAPSGDTFRLPSRDAANAVNLSGTSAVRLQFPASRSDAPYRLRAYYAFHYSDCAG